MAERALLGTGLGGCSVLAAFVATLGASVLQHQQQEAAIQLGVKALQFYGVPPILSYLTGTLHPACHIVSRAWLWCRHEAVQCLMPAVYIVTPTCDSV
jgi:hypothetical protein